MTTASTRDKLERFKFWMYTNISEKMLDDIYLAIEDVSVDLSVYDRWMYNHIMAGINVHILGQRLSDKVSVKYPLNWWEAAKDRFLPGWAKDRWPTRYARVSFDIVALSRKLGDPDNYRIIARVLEGNPGAIEGIEYDHDADP